MSKLVNELIEKLNTFLIDLNLLDNISIIEGRERYTRLIGRINIFNKKYYPKSNLTPLTMLAGHSRNRKIQAHNEENNYHRNISLIENRLTIEKDNLEEDGLPDHLKKKAVKSSFYFLKDKTKSIVPYLFKLLKKFIYPILISLIATIIYVIYGDVILSYFN